MLQTVMICKRLHVYFGDKPFYITFFRIIKKNSKNKMRRRTIYLLDCPEISKRDIFKILAEVLNENKAFTGFGNCFNNICDVVSFFHADLVKHV